MIAAESHFSSDMEVLEVKDDPAVVVTNPISAASPPTFGETFLSNFDAAKYSYDYSSTSTAFNLPNSSEYPEIQSNERYTVQQIAAEHPSFKPEISKIFLSHLFRTKLAENIKFIDGTRINNSKIHDNLMLCRNMLASAGQNSDFTYLFLLAPGYNPVYEDHVFTYGAQCGNLPAEYLGDPSTGVVLSNHPDTCTLPPLIPFIPHRIIIFKALQGPTKYIPINSKTYPNNDIPEESFGAHVAFDERGAETLFDIYTQSLVYIYDKKDSETFYMYPRTLYPYAAVTFYIDIPYHPAKPLRLPWYPSNIFCKTTFNFDPVFRLPVDVYRLFDNNSRFTELSLEGISVRNMITFSDLGRWSVLRELFSGVHGDFYNCDQLHLQGPNLPADYFISHCILASVDPRFVKIIRGMIIPQVGALFSVPYIPKMNTAEGNGGKTCGILLPNSAFASLFGVPVIPGDILHCFFIHPVVIGSSGHPLRTVKREEMLISMSKNLRISRSDKVSDNDIRVALSQTIPQQVMSIEILLESCASNVERERCRAEILKQLLLYDEPHLTVEQCKAGIEAEENEYQNSLKYDLNERKTFTPIFYKRTEEARMERVPSFDTVEKMEVDSPTPSTISSLPSPSSYKTAVILDPKIIMDAQIDPLILERVLQLTTDCTKNNVLSNFTVLYHHCMQSSKLSNKLNSQVLLCANPQRLLQYQHLEDAYCNRGTIQVIPEHTCDTKRTSLRASVVCILTILRKYDFKNAVLLTYAAITDEFIFFQQHKTCLMTPEEYIEKLKKRDSSFLY
uniref:Uncharacterized protein n=1 Tax=Panagrolaimus sp. ES5 TaxID=591445 RepID=A0AC34F2S9_9BILA